MILAYTTGMEAKMVHQNIERESHDYCERCDALAKAGEPEVHQATSEVTLDALIRRELRLNTLKVSR